MIKHLVGVGQEQLREELSLLVNLKRAILNFSPRHGAGIQKRYKKTFFLDKAFCNSLGMVVKDDAIVIGLPSHRYDVNVFDTFSRIQSACGFIVHPMEYIYLVMRAGTDDTRDRNIISVALPFPRTLHDKLADIGRLTFVRMTEDMEFSSVTAEEADSFEIEIRRDKRMFWER